MAMIDITATGKKLENMFFQDYLALCNPSMICTYTV